MAHVEPLPFEELGEFDPLFKIVEQRMGFVPGSMRIMARRPDLLRAFAGLAGTVLAPGSLGEELKQLIAFVASRAAGCMYCQAHTSSQAARAGADPAKIEAAFEFESSPLFTERERAALRLARDGALVPSATTEAHFEELRKHFSEQEIVDVVAVIALFGFLNRFNDTMATPLEDEPLTFASNHLASRGWNVGKHART